MRLYVCKDFQCFIFIIYVLHNIFVFICVCVCNKACHIYTLGMCL
jgi:hypothetical protein